MEETVQGHTENYWQM